MRQLESMAEMALVLAERAVAIPLELHEDLKHLARHLEGKVKAEFGVYQSASGPFPAWDELADSTKDDRVSKGYTENDPLLRSGQERDDVAHQIEGLVAEIGTPETAPTAEIIKFSEFGTSKEPMRPVYGPVGFNSRSAIEKWAGAALVTGFMGRDQIHAALGYDMEIKG